MPAPSSLSADGTDPPRGVDQLRAVLTRMHLIRAAASADRSVRRLIFALIRLMRSLARTPVVGGALDPLLARFDKHDRLHFEMAELLRVCTALNADGLPYWVAGGWGLDALVGCQTRRHHDLDVVLHPFSANLSRVAAVLTRLGYTRQTPLGGILWFPDAEVYADDVGHEIEVVNVNWNILHTIGELLVPGASSEPNGADGSGTLRPGLLDQCTTTGDLGGVAIPTLSLTAQRLFHLGYPQRAEEPHAEDLNRLIAMGRDRWDNPLGPGAPLSDPETRQPSTLLLIPIFTFPPDLWRLCRLYHNDLMIPPHVTLAVPFRPLAAVTEEVVEQLAQLFSRTAQFDFELGAVRWFGTEVVYLQPSRAEEFRAIVEGIQRVFPDFQPYGGAFDSVIPHVTLSEHGSLADRRIVGRLAPQYTPIPARASHVWLMSNQRGFDDWAIVKIFEMGTAVVSATENRNTNEI